MGSWAAETRGGFYRKTRARGLLDKTKASEEYLCKELSEAGAGAATLLDDIL